MKEDKLKIPELTPEEVAEMDKAWAEAIEAEKQVEKEFKKKLKYYLDNRTDGQPRKAVEELLEGSLWNQHVGYVNVCEYNGNYNRFGYTGKLYQATEESIKEYPELKNHVFTEVEDNEYGNKTLRYLCWQTMSFEDDYRGYLLFPMKDGRYWCVWFNM